MSLSKSKCWYSNNCLHFLKHAVPLFPVLLNQDGQAAMHAFNSFTLLNEILNFFLKPQRKSYSLLKISKPVKNISSQSKV
jgi:hypothetical protein